MKVLASGNKKAFDYILKWYANVAGKKNQSVLYLRGPEGINKSTMIDFIRDHVLG